MKITEELIQQAEDAGACEEALIWLRESPRTLKELGEYNPDWYLWADSGCLIPREISQELGFCDDNNNLFCRDCEDCKNCTNCWGCTNCTDCTNCWSCWSCWSCRACTSCTNCRACTSCGICEDCEDCTNCTNCTNCIGCWGCTNCTYCTKEKGLLR